MADVTLPQLGETVTEGTITRWFKKVGDTIAADEALFEVSTDKVDTEVPSPVAGVLLEIRANEGDTVPVGAVIAVVGDAAAAPRRRAAPAPAPAARGRAARAGARARACAGAAGRRAPRRLPPPTPAPLRRRRPAAGAGARRGVGGPADASADGGAHRRQPAALAGRPSPGGRARHQPRRHRRHRPRRSHHSRRRARPHRHACSQAGAAAPPAAAPAPLRLRLPPAPAPRRCARSGPGAAPAAAPVATPPAAAPAVRVGRARHGGVAQQDPQAHRQPHGDEQVASARTRSAWSRSTTPTSTPPAAKVKGEWKATEGFSLTYLPFITRAVVDALAEFPHLNASVGDDELVVHNFIDIGIAVDLDYQGLLVPVVRSAETKRLRAIAREINDLAGRARTRKLSPDEITRRHVHHHQQRIGGQRAHDAHHQPAAGGHPLHRRHRAQAGGGQPARRHRGHRHPPGRQPGDELGPPGVRRRLRRRLPRSDQASSSRPATGPRSSESA